MQFSFFCSGYSLFHGSRKTGFIKWMVKRILCLYPCMWLFLFLSNLCLNTDYSWIDFTDTPFWFVNTIFIFYFGYYIIIHYIPTKIPLVIMALSIPYLGIYFFFNNHSSFLIDWTENPTCLQVSSILYMCPDSQKYLFVTVEKSVSYLLL